MVTGKYETDRFYELAKGFEDEKEGGERCHKCYELRLKEAANIAKEQFFDYFTTTLSISPHKNSQVLNRIGEKVGKEFGVLHLPCDFKKKGGFKRSCEITEELGLYRQDYCGCVYSKVEMDEKRIRKEKAQLREDAIERAKSLDSEYKINSDKKIIEKLLKSGEYKNSKIIFSYVGKDPEINTIEFIKRALLDGKIISVPYCEDNETMNAYRIEKIEDLVEGKFNILEPIEHNENYIEPENIDLIVVPCSTADLMGNRIGFGRGYYDRFFQRTNAKKILLIRSKQIWENIPMEKHDVKIESVITEID